MTFENADIWTKTYGGLINLRSITSGECYATIYTSGIFNRVDVTVFRVVDCVEYVILQKTIYLDRDIKEDIEEIENKINKVMTEVLGNG